MSVYVGLDCGGSSSRVLAVDADGTTLFQGQSGAANLVSTPEPRLRRNLLSASEGCPEPNYVCGCFAGLVSEEVKRRGEEHLQRIFPHAVVRAEPDYTAAFYASPPETDICVIGGTGSLVCSKSEAGIVKSGGRGYILGDYGSGYHYGRDALLHFLDSEGRVSEGLRDAVLETFETDREGDIVTAVYHAATPAKVLARLVKAFANDAKAGEAYAVESIRRNSALLAEVVHRHIEKHLSHKDTLVLSLAGGLWKAPVFREGFAEQMQIAEPERTIQITRINKPPLYGAVELAKEMNGGHRS